MTTSAYHNIIRFSVVAILAAVPSRAQPPQQSPAVAVPSYESYGDVAHHLLPAWSPDDREISYSEIQTRLSGQQHLYLLPAAGGTSRRMFPGDAWSAAGVWSPDGKRIALTWQGPDGKHIWTTDSGGKDFHQVTRGSGSLEHGPSWSPDGKWITCNSFKNDQVSILIAAADGSSVTTFASGYRPRYSPDGSTIAYTAMVFGFGPPQAAVYIKATAAGAARMLSSTKGAVKLWPSGSDWSPDGGQLAFIRQLPIGSELLLVDVAQDRVVRRIPLEGPAHDPAWSHRGNRIAFEMQTTEHPGEIHTVALDTAKDAQVTRQKQCGSSRRVSYRSPGGVDIAAYLFGPEAGQNRRAGLVWIHGGEPGAGSFDDTYHSDVQYFVDQGFTVLAPNYRGSAGAPPTTAGPDSGDQMVDDIAAGARFLAQSAGVDPRRIGLVGFSFGGYLSLLTAAKTKRTFAAVVDFFGPTDLALLYRDAAPYRPVIAARLGGTPDERPELYRRFSPLSLAESIGAPVLILHGKSDRTIPIEQSIKMADALKAAGKDVRFVTFGSGHGFSIDDDMKAFPEVARFLVIKLSDSN